MTLAIDVLSAIGRYALNVLRSLGRAAFFFASLLRHSPTALRRFGLVVTQVHAVGTRSLVLIMASGLAVGFVLALQMYYALVPYGAAESLGLLVNLSLVRELGPVVTALLFAGRAGTSLTAEIGLMKAGEQLAAMELMAVDPRARVLAPRFLGGVVAMPLLAALFSTVGILGAYVVAVLLIGVDSGNFWSIMQSRVDLWRDIGNGIVKSAVFGVVCTFVALYQGHETQATPEGVAHATTRTVVISSLGVLMMDFVLTALMFSTPNGA
jgi:phospholipid/cholesterol/gamma-HCH transport system permease protein